MAAHVIPIGPPAHDDERDALAFLASGLPSTATVFTNPWLIQPSGAVFELDAVVALPHAIYVVELKNWHGHLQGGPRDWYLGTGERRQSPLQLARKTAQILHSLLGRKSWDAGRAYVQELVFLPTAASFRADGPGIRERVCLRDEVHAVLQDEARLEGLASGRSRGPVTDDVVSGLVQLFQGRPQRPPPRQIAGYRVIDAFDANERYSEVLGEDTTGKRRVLRVYRVPWHASEAEREQARKRAMWEAKVLRSFERAPPEIGLPRADAPVETDDAIVVPLEDFHGSSLPTWLERFGEALDLPARVALWTRIARTMAWTHDRGVVHRHLRPDLVLLADPDPTDPAAVDLRVTGFDLAKRLASGTTIAVSDASKDRLEGAAPEVVLSMSSAEPRSDQFSLGLILAFLVLREPLVASTLPLVERRHRMPRLLDRNPDLPRRLDAAVARMLSHKPTDRYPTLAEAIADVTASVTHEFQPDAAGTLAPGARLGSDYVVEALLGHGGLADVYKVKHRLRGERLAFKVARPIEAAENALRCEFAALRKPVHPQVVNARDLTGMVPDRITLILDFVEGGTLKAAVPGLPDGDLPSRRRLAEDLLSALDTFERIGLSHNDLKPDNLMVTPQGRLVLIDFSLAWSPSVEDEVGGRPLLGGTMEWRDPSGTTDRHASDRYSAAMCLFFLHAGRHPFDGIAPEPDQAPEIEPADVEPPGLAAFFARALAPEPSQRFRTSQAMRDAYLSALGAKAEVATPTAADLSSDTPLAQTDLPPRAVRCLSAAQVRTVGELLAMAPEQLSAVLGLGDRMIEVLQTFAADARARGVPARVVSEPDEPPFFLPLTESLDPVRDLPADTAVLDALSASGLRTVGEIARSSRRELASIKGIGPQSLVKLGQALTSWHARTTRVEPIDTLDGLWSQATRPLDASTRDLLARTLGLVGTARTQGEVAAALGLDQPTVSLRKTAALDRLDRAALAPILGALDGYLEQEHGVLPVGLAAARLARDIPVAGLDPVGFVYLACALDTAAFGWIDGLAGADAEPILVRPRWFSRDVLRTFVQTAAKLVDGWPPTPAAVGRSTLRMVLPEYQGDPVVLAGRLLPELRVTRGGALFRPPIEVPQAVPYALEDVRDGITLDALQERINDVFAGFGPPLPNAHALSVLLAGSVWKVDGDRVVRRDASPPAPARAPGDDPRELLAIDLTVDPKKRVVDVLQQAAQGGSAFRLVVAPPELHRAIGESLVRALGAVAVNLTDAWFSRHAATLDGDARAARLKALQAVTAERMNTLFDELVATHGVPGTTVVVYDTGLLEVLGGLDQVRLLYTRVAGRAAGFWILVVPGVVHQRQPLFNDRARIWHQPGLVLPLNEPL